MRTVTVEDPYYGDRRSFRACPLAEVLRVGFGEAPGDDAQLFLREEGGYLALADASRGDEHHPAWEPIGRRGIDPGPFYVVWTKPEQRDTHVYPWPYQLAAIEVADFARTYPHTLPRTARDGTPAWRGFAIFRGECVACHAVNGEGGKVGPDLNIPQSIVEYRPAEQVKAYIRNPETFRYTTMPAHPHLSATDLDALIAYFDTMKGLKHDPARNR